MPTTFFIRDKELHKRLKIYCATHSKKLIDVAEDAIREYLNRRNVKDKYVSEGRTA